MHTLKKGASMSDDNPNAYKEAGYGIETKMVN